MASHSQVQWPSLVRGLDKPIYIYTWPYLYIYINMGVVPSIFQVVYLRWGDSSLWASPRSAFLPQKMPPPLVQDCSAARPTRKKSGKKKIPRSICAQTKTTWRCTHDLSFKITDLKNQMSNVLPKRKVYGLTVLPMFTNVQVTGSFQGG